MMRNDMPRKMFKELFAKKITAIFICTIMLLGTAALLPGCGNTNENKSVGQETLDDNSLKKMQKPSQVRPAPLSMERFA